MAIDHRLTDIETVAKFIPSSKRVEGDDRPLIEMLIDAATVAIENYIHRPVIIREFTERRVPRGRRLFLERYPIHGVDSVVDDDANAVPSDAYTIEPDTGALLYRGGGLEGAYRGAGACWPRGVGAWTVTYEAGLVADIAAVAAETPDIQLACHILVRDLWRGGPQGLGSKSSGQKGESYVAPRSAFSDEVKSILEPRIARGYH